MDEPFDLNALFQKEAIDHFERFGVFSDQGVEEGGAGERICDEIGRRIFKIVEAPSCL